MKSWVNRYRYELVAAGAGAIVMILELVGARMVAPYFGTSLYVWTAMIGVILGALSAGYWYGGRIADQHATDEKLMKILVLAATAILLTLVVQEGLLALLARLFGDPRLGSLLAALLLFAPPALLLGVVSPYVARLRLRSLKHAGQSIGRLYAAGTFGSILGTFLAGYWLIAWFGNRSLGLGLVVALVLLSAFVSLKGWRVPRAALAIIALLAMAGGSPVGSNVIADVDSAYSRYLVTETAEEVPLRSLVTDPFSTQSAQYVGQPDVLAVGYTQRFKEVTDALLPDAMLVIGGGAYTFPFAVARAYPDTEVQVVEIDPALTGLAREYFGLTELSNLSIAHQDGRVFLNRDTGAYDLVFMDAFSSLTPPYQLMTLQSVGHQQRVTADGGATVANLIARGVDSPYLGAVAATYRQGFAFVDIYQVFPETPRRDQQNLLLVATDSWTTRQRIRAGLELVPLNIASAEPLTDDFAPVEQLINQP